MSGKPDSKPVQMLKGIISKSKKPVSVDDMNEACTSKPLERLRGTVQRYDNPTDPFWPLDDKS